MATPLLNADGSASMATLAMMSHHGLLRDIARFKHALPKLAASGPDKAEALRDEWTQYRNALHGHHTVEDERIFPGLRTAHPELADVFARLDADHRRVDPLLARGDAAFADLATKQNEAIAVVAQLSTLLDDHLAFEEANIVTFLREAKEFPPPATDAEAEMYAMGFAWSLHGIAPNVIAQVNKMLPSALTSRLPAARTAFEQRCIRVWGSAATAESSTSVPASR